jgi:oligopeptide/dipeptide ABC transporter ATP-binding protein
MAEKILEIKQLVTKFRTAQGTVTAVDGISFDVYKGKTLGIVGESGSGKSTIALSIMRLIEPSVGVVDRGAIFFQGQDILQLSERAMQRVRGNHISMIFQEPMTSLNPVFTVGNQIKETLLLHQDIAPKDAQDRCIELLALVGVPAPEKRVHEYPHQLSGGMRQRVMIAMALACKPAVLIADEPTTALDVTIQAQILDLMRKLQEETAMGIILITHDLGVVAEMCDEVAVMYCGSIVEQADVKILFRHSAHPYTQGLLNSIPSLGSLQTGQEQRLTTIEGVVPPLSQLPLGCNFQDRCVRADAACKGSNGDPNLEEVAPHHLAACFHPLHSHLQSS